MTVDQTTSRFTLLICTVGGTPEPIVQALLHWRPAAVRFVVSAQTRQQVDAVLRAYAEHTSAPLSPGCYKIISLDDPEDLSGVVVSIRSVAVDVGDWHTRGGEYHVVADFTGGTKCMSAALALVARRWPCEFSYVGGARRSKDGVGLVESGFERVVLSASPWDALGYQAIEDAVTVFNHGGYAAAAALLEPAIRSATDTAVKRELSSVKAVTDAYAAWDRFDHREAAKRFSDALRNRNDLAAVFTDDQGLINRIKRHADQSTQLADEEGSIGWIADLFFNAGRRAAECRFDDAVARLYRAFEALAQVRLRTLHGIADTKAVAINALPEALQQQWKGRARNGRLLLGLRDAYATLRALGDELGEKFVQVGLDDDEKSPLAARNQSILAHGFEPVSEKVYNVLRDRFRNCASVVNGLNGFDTHGWSLPRPR